MVAELDWNGIEAARRRRARAWALHDDVLYGMCAAYPQHSNAASVNAKVGIIARAYATGIERKVPSDNTQSSSLGKLAAFIVDHGARIDSLLEPLQRIREPLTADKLKTIVERHGSLVQLLRPLLRRKQASRSFWSKYMHFHCPAVPVYDSYVAHQLPSVIRWAQALEVFRPKKPFDEVYCRYAMRFFALYRFVRQRNPRVRVKDLDFYLLSL